MEDAIAEAQHLKRKAERAKDGTGGNVSRMMLFWPAWAKTLHNADVAIVAADDRKYHLGKIMKRKGCKNINSLSAEASNATSSKNSISQQLNELNALYKAGALTEEEFKDAKKRF